MHIAVTSVCPGAFSQHVIPLKHQDTLYMRSTGLLKPWGIVSKCCLSRGFFAEVCLLRVFVEECGKYKRADCNCVHQKEFPKAGTSATFPKDRRMILLPQNLLSDSSNNLTVILVMTIPLNWVGFLYREKNCFYFLCKSCILYNRLWILCLPTNCSQLQVSSCDLPQSKAALAPWEESYSA